MDFGKVKDLDKVNFKLPKDPWATTALLNKLPPRTHSPIVYYGCTGWAMKEWVGTYYPLGTSTKDFLKEYAKQFNTIELNTTHYRIPDSKMISNWVESTPEYFKFSPKVPQSISHSNDLALSSDLMAAFSESILGLGTRLGTSFLQLPPYFGLKQLDLLHRYLERIPLDALPLAIELREEELFAAPDRAEALWSLLTELGVGTVITDVAGRRDVLHQRLTTPIAMIRFVGNGLHATDYQRVDEWVLRLKDWFSKGLEAVYFFHHQPENIYSPDMTVYFMEQINAALDLDYPVPQKYINQQLNLFS